VAIHFGDLFKTMTGLAARGVGLAREPMPLQQPPPALPPATVDRVDAWFDDIQLTPTALKVIEEAAAETSRDSRAQSLTSVDDLQEAVKRLDAQLDAILESLQTYNRRP
jgi:hypothetical protein